ncbi:MAG: sugar ABC transporter substrate-binding protein [Bacteroidota bacterium]
MKQNCSIIYRLWPCLVLFPLLWCCQPKDDRLTIGVSFETLQTEYWVTSINAIEAACEKHNIRFLSAVSNGDANRQFEQVNNFISRGVDGIIIAPKDGNTVIPVIKAANRANIPIVLYNRSPAKDIGQYVTVAANNYDIAFHTTKYLCELARQSGRQWKALELIGNLGDINAVERSKGFNAAIAQYPNDVEVVAAVPTEWNQEKALAGTTNALQAHPDIDFIFSASDFLIPPIVSALKNADKYHPIGHEKHVLFGAFDGDATAYQLLKEGYLDADGVQDVFFECEASVQAVVDILKGNPPEKVLVDPGFVIHTKNLEAMAPKMWGAAADHK